MDSTTLLTGQDALAHRLPDLEQLFDETDAPATARWASVRPWLEQHPEVTPVLILIKRSTDLVAGALLGRVSKVGVTTWTILGPRGEPSWLPALDAQAAADLGRAILDSCRLVRGPWLLDLRDLPQDDPVVRFLADADPAVIVQDAALDPRLVFTDAGRLNDYLSLNTRKALAKARNRMKRAHLQCDLDWLESSADIASALPEVVDLHRARNRQIRGYATLDDGGEQRIFERTIMDHADRGACRLLTLRLDRRLAAFAVCFRSGRTLHVYANLVSPDWLHYSSGAVANAEVVRHAHADPSIALLDWGPGVQRYKLGGKVTVQTLVTVRRWSPAPLRLLVRGLERGRAVLARAWRRTLAPSSE